MDRRLSRHRRPPCVATGTLQNIHGPAAAFEGRTYGAFCLDLRRIHPTFGLALVLQIGQLDLGLLLLLLAGAAVLLGATREQAFIYFRF